MTTQRTTDGKAENRSDAEPRTDAGKKSYTPPRLEEYGSVAALTTSGGSSKVEGGNPRSRP